MPGDIIPLHRVKLLERGEVPVHLLPVDKTPRKDWDMRMSRPPSRLAGRELDGVAPLAALKPSHRIGRAPKMRLFRSFKLFTGMKRQPPAPLRLERRRRERSAAGKFGRSAS